MSDKPLVVQLLESNALKTAISEGVEKNHSRVSPAMSHQILDELSSLSSLLNLYNTRLEKVEKSIENLTAAQKASTTSRSLNEHATKLEVVEKSIEDLASEQKASTDQLTTRLEQLIQQFEDANADDIHEKSKKPGGYPFRSYPQVMTRAEWQRDIFSPLSSEVLGALNTFYNSLSPQLRTNYDSELRFIRNAKNTLSIYRAIQEILDYYQQNNHYIEQSFKTELTRLRYQI